MSSADTGAIKISGQIQEPCFYGEGQEPFFHKTVNLWAVTLQAN